jgi:putative NADH-flavin reductase
MKLTIFGSTGPTGQYAIKLAIEKGFNVVAYARNPSKITIKDKNLTVIKGELNDDLAIEYAVRDAGAVLSFLGPKGNLKDTKLSDGMKNIVAAMEKQGVKRLVALGTASITDEKDNYPFKFRLLVKMVKTIAPGAYSEIRAIGAIIKNSNLDWTIGRVSILNSKPLSKIIICGYYGKEIKSLGISRADMAWFFIDQIDKSNFIKKAPAISN